MSLNALHLRHVIIEFTGRGEGGRKLVILGIEPGGELCTKLGDVFRRGREVALSYRR